MANDDIQHFFPDHNPVSRATVPTAGGIFPLHQRSQAGRKRTPMLDLRVHDAQVKLDGTANLLDFAWAIISKAHGGDWALADPNWRMAAERFRSRYLTEVGQSPEAAGGEPMVVGAHLDRQLDAIRRASTGAHAAVEVAPEPVAPSETLDAFLARLAAVPPTVAMNEIPGWDGRDETFAEAATNRWNELNQVRGGPTPLVPTLVDPGLVGGPGGETIVSTATAERLVAATPAQNNPSGPTVLVIDQPDAQGLRPVVSRRDPEEDAETSSALIGGPGTKAPTPAPVTVAVPLATAAPLSGERLEEMKEEIRQETERKSVNVEGLDLSPPDKVEKLVENLSGPQAEALDQAIQGTAGLRENADSGSRVETSQPEGKTDVEPEKNPQAPSNSDPDTAPPAPTPAFVPPPPTPRKNKARPTGPKS